MRAYSTGTAMILGARYSADPVAHVALTADQLAVRNRILDRLAKGIYRTREVPCFCGCSGGDVIALRDRYGLPVCTILCPDCGLLRTSPQMDNASAAVFYVDDYRGLYQSAGQTPEELFAWQQAVGTRIAAKCHAIVRTARTVAEVGCGAGGVLDVFARAGKRVAGCDYTEEYLTYGRSRGLDLVCGDADELCKASGPADFVLLVHVLEHFSDLRRQLTQIRNLMHRTSILYVEVPGLHSIRSTYQNDFLSFLQNAHNYHFNAASLSFVLTSCGFDIHAVSEQGVAIAMLRGSKCLAVPQIDRENAEKVFNYLLETEALYQSSRSG